MVHMLKELGVTVDPKQSVDALKGELKQSILSLSYHAFNKKLYSIIGSSRGCISLNCCHGVSYAVKALLKHESPTDYVDLLRPLENLPMF